MPGVPVVRTYARRRLVRRELARLIRLAWHGIFGHDWGQWRVETEAWFEYVDGPVSGAWRACRSGCGAIEHVRRFGSQDSPPPGFRGIDVVQEHPVEGDMPEPGWLAPHGRVLSNLTFHARRQAQEALALATARTGKLGGWSRDARDPATLRRSLETLARNTIVLADALDAAEAGRQ